MVHSLVKLRHKLVGADHAAGVPQKYRRRSGIPRGGEDRKRNETIRTHNSQRPQNLPSTRGIFNAMIKEKKIFTNYSPSQQERLDRGTTITPDHQPMSEMRLSPSSKAKKRTTHQRPKSMHHQRTSSPQYACLPPIQRSYTPRSLSLIPHFIACPSNRNSRKQRK